MKYRKLKSLEYKYEINELGQIRNTKSKKILKQRVNMRGYYVIGYNDKDRGHCVPKELHRLVAEAWMPNEDNLPCVNHIDGVKLNNSVSNLEWCTYSQNSMHAYKTGLSKKPPAKEYKVFKLKDETNKQIFNGYKEAYGYCLTNGLTKGKYKSFVTEVRKVCKGERQTAFGIKWSY